MTRQKYTTKNKHLPICDKSTQMLVFTLHWIFGKNHILRLHPQCMKLHSKCGYYSVGAHNFVLLFNHYHTTRKNLRNQQLQHISPLVCLLSWTNPLWCKTIRRNKDKWYIFSSDGHPMHIPWPSATHQPPSVPRMIDNRKTSVVIINPSAGIEYTNIQYINLRFRFNVDCYVDFSPKSGIDLYSFSLSYPVDYPQVMNEKRNSDITFKKNKNFNATAFFAIKLVIFKPPVSGWVSMGSREQVSYFRAGQARFCLNLGQATSEANNQLIWEVHSKVSDQDLTTCQWFPFISLFLGL